MKWTMTLEPIAEEIARMSARNRKSWRSRAVKLTASRCRGANRHGARLLRP